MSVIGVQSTDTPEFTYIVMEIPNYRSREEALALKTFETHQPTFEFPIVAARILPQFRK